MRKNIFTIICLILISCLVSTNVVLSYQNQLSENIGFDQQITENNEKTINKISVYPVMRVDKNLVEQWTIDYQQAALACIDRSLHTTISETEDFDILHLLKYTADERDQGWCSNCWAWPATAVLEIALNVQEGIYDRLSVQYINSCGTYVGSECCEGGNLDIFARFYRYTDMAIPWSNTNAEWKDKYAQCLTPCDSIEKEPNYPISAIYQETIQTHNIAEEQAIENIKNILHQQKGVYFSWYLPNLEYRQDFSNFWSSDSETSVYNLDWDCGTEFNEEEGGGHGVLCVGYHDEAGEDNDYWIMLNSWGAPSGRPNGLFRINMHMDYDCSILFDGREYYSFDFQTLDISFGTEDEAPDPPQINGPDMGKPDTEYTYQFSTFDYQDDQVYIMIDWGDGETTDWIGPVASDEVIEQSHTWSSRDDYFLRAKAKDNHDKESLWANLEVTISKNKAVQWSLLEFILQHFQFFPFSFLNK